MAKCGSSAWEILGENRKRFMTDPIEIAFQQVKAAFAHYPKPTPISHCPMCFRDEEIARFVALAEEKLQASDFD